MLESDAGERAENFAALKLTLSRLLQDPDLRELRVNNGNQLLEENRGALQRTTRHMQGLLKLKNGQE
ncbi:MAG: hypothetical protein F4Z97_01160 [Gammaproteobacteria bacterium]|nr:hypothetical protein [Gammaproteobacteria bacterium]